jgi:hypothetical protein
MDVLREDRQGWDNMQGTLAMGLGWGRHGDSRWRRRGDCAPVLGEVAGTRKNRRRLEAGDELAREGRRRCTTCWWAWKKKE